MGGSTKLFARVCGSNSQSHQNVAEKWKLIAGLCAFSLPFKMCVYHIMSNPKRASILTTPSDYTYEVMS